MTIKTNRILPFFLVLILFCVSIPLSSSASVEVYVYGRAMESGEYLAEGADMVTDQKPSGGYAYLYTDVDGKNVLVLNNYDLDAKAETAIFTTTDLIIELVGKNTLTSVRGTLVHINGDLTVKGEGLLNISGGTSSSICVRNGDFTLENGNLVCNAVDFGLDVSEGKVFIKGGNFIASSEIWYALEAFGGLEIGENIKVTASENKNGSPLTEFNLDNLSSYKYLVFEMSYVIGDINGDGKVNVFDYAVLKAYYLDKSVLEGTQIELADVNSDGSINVFDCVALKSIINTK